MRLIDLDEFRKELFSYFLGNGEPLDVLEALERIQDCFDNTPTVTPESPQWISVKDRLPEAGQSVLLIAHGWTNDHNDIYVGSLSEIKADETGETNFWGVKTPGSEWTIWGWCYLKAPNVTHWMPLPEPPEEE